MRDVLPYLKKLHQNLGKEDQIRIILEETDFEKIHKVMKFLNWRWHIDNDVPTIERLKEEAHHHLEQIWDFGDTGESNYYSCGTGGFRASKYVYHGLTMLGLAFELTGWDFDYNDVMCDNYE